MSPRLIHSLSFGNKIDAQSNVYKLFSQYWDIVKWSLPLQIFFSISIQILNILKKDKIGIIIIIVCNLLNIIGNFLFTQIYPFGIKGLGYSTVIVFLSGLIVALIYISKAEFIGADLNRKDSDRFKKSIRKLSVNSILIFLSIGVFNIGSLIFNHLALSISSNTLIIYGVSSQIRQMFSLTTRGFSGGFLVQLGTVIKERQYTSIIPIYWSATLWIGIVYVLGCLLMMITPNSLINIFGNTSQNLTAHISYFLFIGGFILLIQILPRMSQIGFLSIESPHYLVIQSVFLVFIESLFAYYLIQISGYKGLILGQLFGNLLTTIIFVPLFFYLIQKKFKYAIR
jgi:Na+-driven multidrug efflux pump